MNYITKLSIFFNYKRIFWFFKTGMSNKIQYDVKRPGGVIFLG